MAEGTIDRAAAGGNHIAPEASLSDRVLSFIGGTGPEGLGLAIRFAHAGYPIIIGLAEAGARRRSGPDRARSRSGRQRSRDGERGRGRCRQRLLHHDPLQRTAPYAGIAARGHRRQDRHQYRRPSGLREGQAGRYMDLEDNSAAEESQKLAPNARVAAPSRT